tara:strand:- start:518 stop:1501 length:984 start_codon:yes stop_codon:yes gene_type:complete
MSNNLRKILICGLGSIGRRYLRIIKNNWPEFEVAVLRSGYGPKCEELKLIDYQPLNIKDSIDWEPDAVIISSPANIHFDQAIAFGSSGIPCLIEKPLGTSNESFEKSKKLIHLSKSVTMLLGYIYRHDPCANLIKNRLNKNTLGKIVEADFYCGSWLPNWRQDIDYLNSVSANKELGGGVLLELSHEIDIANWFLGPIKINFANLKSSGLLPIDVEDRAYLMAENDKGVQISIRLNFCSEPSKRKIEIRGEKGQIFWDLIHGKLEISNENNDIYQSNLNIDRDSLFLIQIKHFFDCIFGKYKPKCSISEGIYILELIREAKKIYRLS